MYVVWVMKLLTHIVFALGVSTVLSKVLGLDLYQSLIIWGIIVVQHHAIDKLSHEIQGTHRTPLFHSPLGVSILSIALSLLGPAVDYRAQLDKLIFMKYVVLVLVSGWTHLLLDVLNPGGIYWRGRRRSVARIRYNDPLVNTVLQLAGTLLILYSLLFKAIP